MAGSNRKKARKSKTSKHEHGAGGKLNRPLSGVEKVLLGGGALVGINNSRTKRATKILLAAGHSPSTGDERPRPKRSVKEQLEAAASKRADSNK
jgi:hypothetical protein